MAGRIRVERNEGIISTGAFAINTVHQTRVELADPPPAADVDAPEGLVRLRQASVTEALFVGRGDELAAIDAALANDHGVITQAITGLGGIGKSTLAERFAIEHRGRYNPIWWVTAESPAQLEAGLAGLARRLHPPLGGHPDETALQWCLAWLDTHDGWLVVLDNVTRPGDVVELIGNHRRGRFLVTSRQTEGWTGLAVPTRLDILPADQARELLGRLTDNNDGDGADELCAALGGLPLAIELAGAYLVQNNVTARAYLDRLTRSADAWSWVPAGGDPRRTVGRVWQVTLDRIAAEHGPLPGELLRTLAWFAPDDIPWGLLGPDADDVEALGRLVAYGLVSRSDNGDGVSVHRLVQAVNRGEDLPEAAAVLQGAWLRCETWEERERLGPHLDAAIGHGVQAGTHLTVCTELADLLIEIRGRRPAVDAHLAAVLAKQYENEHDGAADVLRTRAVRARGRVEEGYDEANIGELEAIVAQALDGLGRRHPTSVYARLVLALAYARAGALLRSRDLLRRTIPDAVRAVGRDHDYTLGLRAGLIELCEEDTRRFRRFRRGAWRAYRSYLQAHKQYEEMLASLERVYGADDPRVLQTLAGLAELYEHMGQYGQVAKTYEHVLAARERSLGPDAEQTQSARDQLAHAYVRGWHPERAVPLYERIAGPDAGPALLLRIAEEFEEAVRADLAVPWYERLVATREAEDPPDEREVLRARNNLAVAHARARQYAVAARLLAEVLPGYRRVFGAEHSETRLVEGSLIEVEAASRKTRPRHRESQ